MMLLSVCCLLVNEEMVLLVLKALSTKLEETRLLCRVVRKS